MELAMLLDLDQVSSAIGLIKLAFLGIAAWPVAGVAIAMTVRRAACRRAAR
jgi:hypothetical protein